MKKSLFLIAAVAAGTVSAGEFGAVIKGTSGFTADFKSPSAAGVYANDPGTLAPDTNHEYDDGYVRDNLLSAGATPDWGFNSKSQVTPAVGGFNFGATLDFSSSRTIGSGVNKSADQDGLEPGFELFYRDMPWKGERSSLGWMVGLTYQRAGIKSSGTATFNTEVTTDTYTYSGVFPNVGNPLFPAPYDNTDPALLLPDVPARTVTAGTLAYQYNREINADLFGIKAGPVWELSLMDKLSLVTGAGVSMQWIRSEFSYTDGATSGATTDDGILFGAYAQGDLEYAVSDRWRLFAGVEWGTQQSFDQSADGYEAELKGASLIFGRLGVAVSF
jgi:hypothetical protein